ncbi:hypothetical protein N665_0026s0062 [Sinapis alba]|nr:hypothetical protein N665_0026s0062 [Sinapis alba]
MRFKCNIGFSWSETNQLAGASCVIHDEQGQVMMHCRECFSQASSLFLAKVKIWDWALESMMSLRVENFTFASTSTDLIKALNELKEWPAFLEHLTGLLDHVNDQPTWDIIFEFPKCNKGAALISQSVVNELRLQSYVSQGAPSLLHGFS